MGVSFAEDFAREAVTTQPWERQHAMTNDPTQGQQVAKPKSVAEAQSPAIDSRFAQLTPPLGNFAAADVKEHQPSQRTPSANKQIGRLQWSVQA